jgi:hypothetical protein
MRESGTFPRRSPFICRVKCPFHDDTIGTAYLYAAACGITYHCFGCGDAGVAERLPDGTYRLTSNEMPF